MSRGNVTWCWLPYPCTRGCPWCLWAWSVGSYPWGLGAFRTTRSFIPSASRRSGNLGEKQERNKLSGTWRLENGLNLNLYFSKILLEHFTANIESDFYHFKETVKTRMSQWGKANRTLYTKKIVPLTDKKEIWEVQWDGDWREEGKWSHHCNKPSSITLSNIKEKNASAVLVIV